MRSRRRRPAASFAPRNAATTIAGAVVEPKPGTDCDRAVALRNLEEFVDDRLGRRVVGKIDDDLLDEVQREQAERRFAGSRP